MPLFYQHNINGRARLAVWYITETEDFFLEKVTLQTAIRHPHKRLQHLAGRYLLQLLHPDFPLHLISITESKKPLLSNEKFHFSISHCGDYAAAIVSESKLVGIDVEIVTPKIDLVKNKFLAEKEIKLLSFANLQFPTFNFQLLTLAWSAKEAIYKWHGKGSIGFKKNMVIDKLSSKNRQGSIDAHFIKEERIDLKIEFRFFNKLCLAWVVK